MAACPTAPAAPDTMTHSLFLSCPRVNSVENAATNGTLTTAACSAERFLGRCAAASLGTARYSACVPSRLMPRSPPVPQTSVPTRLAGLSAIRPAKSRPTIRGRTAPGNLPWKLRRSLRLMPAASISTSTFPGFDCGFRNFANLQPVDWSVLARYILLSRAHLLGDLTAAALIFTGVRNVRTILFLF